MPQSIQRIVAILRRQSSCVGFVYEVAVAVVTAHAGGRTATRLPITNCACLGILRSEQPRQAIVGKGP